MLRRCAVQGCYERVAIDERLCFSHAIGMSPAAERAMRAAQRRAYDETERRPSRQSGKTPSGPMVPLHVSWRYRYAGVTPRMLDWWRSKGWLGPEAKGSGYAYDWDDPSVMFQCRWLAQLHHAGHELTDCDARGGFELHGMGAEFAVKINGRWQAATADEIGWLCTHSEPFTAARVPALASTPSAASPPAAGGVDGTAGRRPHTQPRRVPNPASGGSTKAHPAGASRRGGDAPAVTGTTGAG